MLSSPLAFLVLSCLAQNVTIESPILSLGQEQFFDLPTVVPGGMPGTIRGNVQLQSNRIDPATGSYVLPQLQAYWRITGQGGVVVSPDRSASHGWYGWRLPKDPLTILSFDEQSGATTARVSLLLGEHADRYEYPILLGGTNTIDVVIGWADTLSATDGSPPTGYDWDATLTVQASMDDVWVWITQAQSQQDSFVPVVIRLDGPASSARTLQLEATTAGLLSPSTYTVTIPSGAQDAVLDVHTAPGAIGKLRLQASEGGQIVSYSNESDTTVGGSTRFGEPGGTLEEPEYNWPLYKKCVPASSYQGTNTETVCGTCTNGTPTVECPPTAVLYISSSCKFAVFDACYNGGNATITGPTYSLYSINVVQCGSVGGSIGKWGMSTGGSITLNKLCCIYQATGGTGSATTATCQ